MLSSGTPKRIGRNARGLDSTKINKPVIGEIMSRQGTWQMDRRMGETPGIIIGITIAVELFQKKEELS